MKKAIKQMLALIIAAFSFASCSDVPMPFGIFTEDENIMLEGGTGSGTAEDPFNVIAAINYVKNLTGSTSTEEIYIKGKVVSITENYGTQYGNATFYISDDGTSTNMFRLYRAWYLNNEKYSSPTDPLLSKGDDVVVCGRVRGGAISSSIEKGAYLYSLTKGDVSELGSPKEPLTVAQALESISSLDNNQTGKNAYVKGIVAKIGTFNENNGNLSYYISDDGKDANTIQAYKGLGLNRAPFTAATNLAVGDEVVVYGPLYKYVNSSGAITPEINEGNYLIALTKGDGPVLPTNTIGSKENPITVESALDRIAQLDKDTQSELQAYIKGKVVSVITNDENAKKYHNLDYIISSDGKENGKTLKVFRGKGINGADFNANGDLKPGDEVVVLGFLYNYQGTTPEINEGSILVSHTKGSGTTPDPQSDTPTIEGVTMTKSVNDLVVTFTNPNATAGSSVEYDLTTTSIANQTENPSFTINGVQFAFAASGGSTTPKYWKTDLANEFRLYALNTLTITGTANIAKVTFQCTLHNGKNATGNEQSFAKVDGKKFVFKNNWTSASSGTQCRISKVTITYAK